MQRTLVAAIASAAQARHNCLASNNSEWLDHWTGQLEQYARNELPSGSGIDSGTKIDLDASNDKIVVLTLGYHHMDENGYYDGWTDHTIRVRPAFNGIDLTI